MYSKLAIGLAMAGAASAANIVKRDGDHAHGGGHAHGSGGGHAAAPSDGYGAPAASYGAPAQSYGAPAPSYGAPAPSYGAPAPSYGAPSTGYGQEASYGYEEEGGFDLTAIILPLLILLGLSLLFPGIVSVNVRKKREAMEEGKTQQQHTLYPTTKSTSRQPVPPRHNKHSKTFYMKCHTFLTHKHPIPCTSKRNTLLFLSSPKIQNTFTFSSPKILAAATNMIAAIIVDYYVHKTKEKKNLNLNRL